MSHPVGIVMVKAPIIGTVKTRLVPPLSYSEAAALAACFAQDVVTCVRRIVPEVMVAYAPSQGRAMLTALFQSPDLLWSEQRGKDLGARLEAATAHATVLDLSPIIVIGTDSPTLPESYIEQAIHALTVEAYDLTLGPTEDGGYYLVGLRQFTPNLFQNIAWSTSLAYEQTMSNAAHLHLRTHALPQWYDVDTSSELLRLRHELLTEEKARAQAPATYQWIVSHDSLLSTL